MACYAQHLCFGNTLLCKSIRHDTVCRYLDAVGKLFRDHADGLTDPTVNTQGGGASPPPQTSSSGTQTLGVHAQPSGAINQAYAHVDY